MTDHPLLVPWALPEPPDEDPRPALPNTDESWRSLLVAVLAHRLEAIFLRNLQRAGQLEGAPPEVRSVLERRVTALRMQNLHLANAARCLSEGLLASNVDHLFLKGVVLRSSAYQEFAGRPTGDIDVLVRRADRSKAETVLEELGFLPDADGHASLWHARSASHALGELTYAKKTPVQRVKVDLHWSLSQGARVQPLREAALWQRSGFFDLAGHRARTLARPWFLLHLALHLVKDLIIARPALVGYADLLLSLQTAEDWDEVGVLADRHGVLDQIDFVTRRLAVLDAHARVSARHEDQAIRRKLVERDLLRVRPDDRMDAAGLRSRYYRDLIFANPQWTARLRYAAGLLLPHPDQLGRMHRGSTKVGRPASYLHHLRQAATAAVSLRPAWPSSTAQPPRSHTQLAVDDVSLLRAALLPREDAFHSWRAWSRDRDMTDLARHHYPILPLVYRRLCDDLAEDPNAALLKGQYRHTWARQQLLQREVESLEDELGSRGIRFRRYGWSAALPEGEISSLGDAALALEVDDLASGSTVALGRGWMHARRHRTPPLLLPLAQRFDRRATRRFAKAPSLRLRLVGTRQLGQGGPKQQLLETLAASAERPHDSKLGWLIDIARQLEATEPDLDHRRLVHSLGRGSHADHSADLLQSLADAVGRDWPGLDVLLRR